MSKTQEIVQPPQAPKTDIENPHVTHGGHSDQKVITQYFAAAVACLGGLLMGTVGGYTSPSLPAIEKQFSLNAQQVSLVVSLGLLPSLPGGFMGGAMSDYFGRKLALIFACVVHAVGWLLLACAPNLAVVYAGRAITGLGQGMVSTCSPVYVAEIASPQVRGKLGSFYQLFVILGILYVYILGLFLTWKGIALACVAAAALQAFLMLLLPETPVWLRKYGYHEYAAASMKWLHRSDSAAVAPNETSSDQLTLRSIADPAVLKPLGIIVAQMFVEQCSGITVVIMYAASIFKAANVPIDSNVASTIVACSMLVAVLAAYVLVDRLGRRILLIISGFFMSVGIISLGTYYFFSAKDPTSTADVTWLPIASLVIYVFALSIGYGPVPWIMMGELFPTKARGLASGVTTSLKWTFAFITAQEYQDMKDAWHDYGVFWFFGAVCVFGFVFPIFFVPETKGKTLDELERYFKGQNKESEVTAGEQTDGSVIVSTSL